MIETDVKKRKEHLSQTAFCQQTAAANPSKTVWVEASAGTGKTRVLSDRVVRLLLQGVNPARILCLTYTKAAAVEMNARISKRLANWTVFQDNELAEDLKSFIAEKLTPAELQKLMCRARILFALMLDVPDGIKIQTIHSFCQEVLKRFPLEAGVSPYFKVMDDRLAAEATQEAQAELVLKIENEPNNTVAQAVAYLTSVVTEYNFSDLMKTLAKERTALSRVLRAYPNFEAFLQALQNKLNLKQIRLPQEVLSTFKQNIDTEKLKQMVSVLMTSKNKKAVKCAENLEKQSQNFDYESYKNIFLTKGNIRDIPVEKKILTAYPWVEKMLREEAEKILALEEELKKIKLYHATCALMHVAGALADSYNAFKKKNSSLDYEDLIVLTRRLLENNEVADWVLYKLDGGVSHVLIDEAQDTSPNQWAIVKALTAEFFSGLGQQEEKRTVFVVGDRKQSIYSFQGADPEAFDAMASYFAKAGGQNFEKVKLDVSFRSTAAVLETVNSLFALPEAKSGVVSEDEKVSHLPYRLEAEGLVELWEIEEPDNDEKDDAWHPPFERDTKTTPVAELAAKVAQKIYSMVQNGEILRAQNRQLKYRDFMVLVQRRRGFVKEFIRACKQIGVDILGADRLKITEQIAVEDLLSLGHFLLLPTDDLSLAEVLKSPLFGLDDDDLIKLCVGRSPKSLWQQLRADPLYEKTASVLSDLLTKADILRPFDLYQEVLCTLKGRQKFISRLGAEAEDALDEFINLTLEFEKEHVPSLQLFIEWLEKDDIEIKRDNEQPDVNAVRLMTVHGSKGLQAPIVILPDTVHVPTAKKKLMTLKDGDNMVYFPLDSETYDENCLRVFENKKQKELDEYRRLLYVALTRAEDRLYICGYKNSKKNNQISSDSWYNLCQEVLQKTGIKENKKWVYRSKQLIEKETPHEIKKRPQQAVYPAWLETEAMSEAPLERPFTPSNPNLEDETPAGSPLLEEGNFYRRGTIIHRLLQLLPWQADIKTKAVLLDAYLAQSAADLSQSSRAQIKKELLDLFENPAFDDIFGVDSQAEVPIIGRVGDKIVSAQLDRLIVLKDKAVIIDFKTNRPAATTETDVPTVYKNQLAVYKQLVSQIYKDKEVETYILWTNTGKLMKIN